MRITPRGNFVEPLESRQMFTSTWASVAKPVITRTIYVSASSSIKTINQAVSASSNNTQILLHRGETFYTSGAVETNSNVLIGSYGSGADPILVGKGGTRKAGSILSLRGNNIRVEGLKFVDGDYDTNYTAISTVTSHGALIFNDTADTSLYNFVYMGKDS